MADLPPEGRMVDVPPGHRLAYRQAGARDFPHSGMFTVYVIRSRSREYWYVGLTNNLQRRFLQHQEGKERTTQPYRPFAIVHTEEFATRLEARNREKYLKSGSGKEWLKANAGVAEW